MQNIDLTKDVLDGLISITQSNNPEDNTLGLGIINNLNRNTCRKRWNFFKKTLLHNILMDQRTFQIHDYKWTNSPLSENYYYCVYDSYILSIEYNLKYTKLDILHEKLSSHCSYIYWNNILIRSIFNDCQEFYLNYLNGIQIYYYNANKNKSSLV